MKNMLTILLTVYFTYVQCVRSVLFAKAATGLHCQIAASAVTHINIEFNRAVALNAGLMKAIGPGRLVDKIVDYDDIKNAIYAPSLKISATWGEAEGKTASLQLDRNNIERIREITGSILLKDDVGLTIGRSGEHGNIMLEDKGIVTGNGSSKRRNKESIKAVLASHRGSIYFIYKKAIRDNQSLKGTVVIEFTIAPNGDIVSARIESSTVHDRIFEQQVLKRIQTWKFLTVPESGDTVIKYPLEFEIE
ncbi:MAG: energy transducer TonB [Nitrospirae bacterium]|nr:energy transducer TonB [Nitrospirota bacterium]